MLKIVRYMKRLSLTIVLLALTVLSGRTHAQQWFFYESFDNVTVDATGSGYVPDGFTLYNDDNEPLADLSYFDMAWKVIRGMNGEGYVAAPSLFTGQGTQADRWLITPAISLQGASAPKLYFRAKADHDQVRDGFALRISTTTTDKSAFSNIRTIREAPGQWTDYVYDLSDYKGKTVYIAFVQNSTGMQMIDIDDIRVGETTTGLGAACNNAYTPLYMIHTHQGSGMSFPVSATLQNWSSTPITSARLCARMDDGSVWGKTFTNLNIAAAGTSLAKQTFSFNFIPETANPNAVFEIWFDLINGQNVSTAHNQVNCFVTEEEDLPYKQVLFEIFSSAMCSNCGPWNKYFHTWDSIIGGNDMNRPDGFVAAKFQVDVPTAGDPLVTSETEARRAYYTINSAPYWTMNGRRFTLMGGENIDQTYQSILDSLYKYQRTFSPFALQARLNVDGQKLTAEVKSTAKLPVQGTYRLYVNLIEDSIREKEQLSEETEYYNIVRKMLPNANGTPLKTPHPTATDSETTYAYTYTVEGSPRFYGSLDRVGVVAYIQNAGTKEIIQAAYASANGGWSQISTWINDSAYRIDPNVTTPNESQREAAADVRLYPNPAGETATLSFRPLNGQRLTVSIINMQGRVLSRQAVQGSTDLQTLTLPTANLTEGLYLVCIESPDGRTSVQLLKK